MIRIKEPVTETVTKKPVTKSLVTKIRELAKRGRPRKPNAMSAAERQRKRRERLRSKT